MTDDRHLTHDELVLHYYGDAGADARRFDRHLAACETCRTSVDRLARALAFVEASPAEEPDAAFEARLWAKLAPALETPEPWWRRLAAGPSTRWAAAGLATATIVAAFAGGWWLRGPDVPEARAGAQAPGGGSGAAGAAAGGGLADAPPTSDDVRTRVLEAAAGDHLERAEIALSELMHAGAADESERDRAADLVAVGRLLRQSAEQSGDTALDALLGDIEVVLMELANAPPEASSGAMAALKTRVENRDLLFRLRVLGNELRHRQETPATPAAKGKTS